VSVDRSQLMLDPVFGIRRMVMQRKNGTIHLTECVAMRSHHSVY
jgi:hypothetical protein